MQNAKTFRLETNAQLFCPCCKKPADAATGDSTGIPVDGDISICLYCGLLMVFRGKGMGLRLDQAPEQLISKLKKNKAFWMKVEAVRHLTKIIQDAND